MTFTGTIDDVNAALARLEYERGSGFERRDVIRIVTSDPGGSAGEPLTDRDLIVVRGGRSPFDFGDHDDSRHSARGPEFGDGTSGAEAPSLATLHRQALMADMELSTG
jgi:hypothetical protein